MSIRVLPPEVAGRIAAGEVIERPASAVKELVENSLDAGAGRIDVEIGGGGLNLIRVVDDGAGVAADELALAFQRHATSKLPAGADLGAVVTLAYPEVRFSLTVDGRETFATAGSGDRRAPAAGVYGPAVATALLPVAEESEGHHLEAVIAPPSVSRANRSYITVFINRRWVRSR